MNGELKVQYLNIIVAGGRAPTMVDSITRYLSSVSLTFNTLPSFRSDGESVMMGCHAGVVALPRPPRIETALLCGITSTFLVEQQD